MATEFGCDPIKFGAPCQWRPGTAIALIGASAPETSTSTPPLDPLFPLPAGYHAAWPCRESKILAPSKGCARRIICAAAPRRFRFAWPATRERCLPRDPPAAVAKPTAPPTATVTKAIATPSVPMLKCPNVSMAIAAATPIAHAGQADQKAFGHHQAEHPPLVQPMVRSTACSRNRSCNGHHGRRRDKHQHQTDARQPKPMRKADQFGQIGHAVGLKHTLGARVGRRRAAAVQVVDRAAHTLRIGAVFKPTSNCVTRPVSLRPRCRCRNSSCV